MSHRKRLPTSIWVGAILMSILLLIGLPILALDASARFLGTRKDRAVGHWQSLGSPPETPTEFVVADHEYAYVRGQDGSLLECDLTGPTADNACWRKVQQPQESGAYVQHGVAYEGKRPPPPGPVKQALDVEIRQYAESVTYARFVLLEDGSVWVWKYSVDANTNLLLLFSAPICGLALAVVLVLGLWLVVGLGALLRARKAKR
jgi:hypothetical protein